MDKEALKAELEQARQPQFNSGRYLASLTEEQLTDQLHGSFPGSSAYDGAVSELARRFGSKQEKLIWVTIWLAGASLAVAMVSLFV